MLQPSRYCILPALAVAIASCRDASESAAGFVDAGGAATISTSDSSGVRVVHISDARALSLPRLEPRLVYSTAADLLLGHVLGAVFLQDGSLVFADNASTEIIFLDPAGHLHGRRGREGEGPGEYTDIARVGVSADGTLHVYDRRQRRYTFMDAQGTVTGVQDIERFGEVVPLARLDGGELIAVFEPRYEIPEGLQTIPVYLLHGDQSWETVHTLGSWAGKERLRTTEGRWNPVAFGATALYAGRGPHVVMATTDSLDLTRFDGPTPVARIRGGATPREITAGEKAGWMDLFLAMYPEERRPGERRRLQNSTLRDTYPAFDALRVDPGGRIWLGDYAKHDEEERQWTVFGADGRPTATVNLPVFHPEWVQIRDGAMTGYGWVEFEVTIPNPEHELLDVMANRIAVLRRDDLEGEFIEVYEVEGLR